jgi:hypothetical protein
VDMGGDDPICDVAGTPPHSESRVDEYAHEPPTKVESLQEAPAEAGDNNEKVVSVASDVCNNAGDPPEESSAGVVTEAESSDAPAGDVAAAEPEQNDEGPPAPDGERVTADAPPEISQTDGHVDLPASSSQNDPSVAPDPAPSVSVSVSDTFSVFSFSPSPDLFTNSEESSADYIGYDDRQVPEIQATRKPLEADSSFASTVVDFDVHEAGSCSEDGVATVNGDTQVDEESAAQDKPLVADAEHEHSPEPPESPSPNTLPSTPSPPNHSESSSIPLLPSVIEKDPKTPSPNRLSISYAGGNRRLVINAEVVETLKVYRQDGRIEVFVNVDKAGDDGLQGILVSIFNFVLCCSYILTYFIRSKGCRMRQSPTRPLIPCLRRSNLTLHCHRFQRSPYRQRYS